MPPRIVRVGVIGCGEVAQVVHIPTLNFMHEYFSITYLCGVSTNALDFCAQRIVNHVPKTTTKPETLCVSPEVDVVFVLSSNGHHLRHTLLALEHDKHVFVEKPMAMTEADARAVIEAEAKSRGSVFVGYMRRYATAFADAVAEIGGLDKILYARVRDIIGPNSVFVDQSATFPRQFFDYNAADTEERAALEEEINTQALGQECQIQTTPELATLYQVLNGLGSHDLSAMREAIGMPEAVVGVSLNLPFWNVLFKYPTFCVSYESGFYDVPLFDAHIEVYGQSKSVRIEYQSPYVKGLPVTLHIREDVGGALKETTIRRTYEDTFTLMMKELYAMVVDDQPVKTTPRDALQDLHIYRMIMRAAAANKPTA